MTAYYDFCAVCVATIHDWMVPTRDQNNMEINAITPSLADNILTGTTKIFITYSQQPLPMVAFVTEEGTRKCGLHIGVKPFVGQRIGV